MNKANATAIILAGGKSSRMGTDKSLLTFHGITLIQHIVFQLTPLFDEVLISANEPDKYAFLGLPVIADKEENVGPLMGILSCLKASSNEINFVTACDIPVMNQEIISKMISLSVDFEIVMPSGNENHFEPLFAVYRKSVVPEIEKLIADRKFKVFELTKLVKSHFITFEREDWYKNLNQQSDYLEFLKMRD